MKIDNDNLFPNQYLLQNAKIKTFLYHQFQPQYEVETWYRAIPKKTKSEIKNKNKLTTIKS